MLSVFPHASSSHPLSLVYDPRVIKLKFRFNDVGNKEPMTVWKQKSDMTRNIKSGQKSIR